MRRWFVAGGGVLTLALIATLWWSNGRSPQQRAASTASVEVPRRVPSGGEAHALLRDRSVDAWVQAGMDEAEARSLGECLHGLVAAMASPDLGVMESHAAARGAVLSPARAAAIAEGVRRAGLVEVAEERWAALEPREKLALVWSSVDGRGVRWESWDLGALEVAVNDYRMPPTELPHMHGWTTMFDPPGFHALAQGVRDGTRPSAWVRFPLKMEGSDPALFMVLFGQDLEGRWHPLNIQTVGSDRTPRLLF